MGAKMGSGCIHFDPLWNPFDEALVEMKKKYKVAPLIVMLYAGIVMNLVRKVFSDMYF